MAVALAPSERAARAANAHQFITRLTQGYYTQIGERGATLSGGERQRVSIARVLLKNAPVLILDEPTSSLDASTQAVVLNAIQRLMQGRTTMIIAHRLKALRSAGLILMLSDGEIAERGTHDELISLNGEYARFVALQSAHRLTIDC